MTTPLHTFKTGDLARYQGGDIKWRVDTVSFVDIVVLKGPKLSRTMTAAEAAGNLVHVWPSDGKMHMPDRLLEVEKYLVRFVDNGYIADPIYESIGVRGDIRDLNRQRDERPLHRNAPCSTAPMPEMDAEVFRRRSENLVAELEQLEVGKPKTFLAAEEALREARVDAMLRYAEDPTPANWATRGALNVAIEEMRRVKGLF